MVYRRLLLGLVLAVLYVPVANAGTGEIRFVETDVDLRADGSAVVAYTVQWAVLSGELHGFYFQGNDRLQVSRIANDSFAVDADGNRYELSIDKVGADNWDIVLARGQGVGSGTVTFVFYFETSFSQAGYVEPTTADDGRELVVFNWAPVQWDEAKNQDHYTLKVLTPHVLPAGVDAREHVTEGQVVLTEPWVNDKFLIDYQRGEDDRLRLVFHNMGAT